MHNARLIVPQASTRRGAQDANPLFAVSAGAGTQYLTPRFISTDQLVPAAAATLEPAGPPPASASCSYASPAVTVPVHVTVRYNENYGAYNAEDVRKKLVAVGTGTDPASYVSQAIERDGVVQVTAGPASNSSRLSETLSRVPCLIVSSGTGNYYPSSAEHGERDTDYLSQIPADGSEGTAGGELESSSVVMEWVRDWPAAKMVGLHLVYFRRVVYGFIVIQWTMGSFADIVGSCFLHEREYGSGGGSLGVRSSQAECGMHMAQGLQCAIHIIMYKNFPAIFGTHDHFGKELDGRFKGALQQICDNCPKIKRTAKPWLSVVRVAGIVVALGITFAATDFVFVLVLPSILRGDEGCCGFYEVVFKTNTTSVHQNSW